MASDWRNLKGPKGDPGRTARGDAGTSLHVANINISSNSDVATSSPSPSAPMTVGDLISDNNGDLFTVTSIVNETTVHVSNVISGVSFKGPQAAEGHGRSARQGRYLRHNPRLGPFHRSVEGRTRDRQCGRRLSYRRPPVRVGYGRLRLGRMSAPSKGRRAIRANPASMARTARTARTVSDGPTGTVFLIIDRSAGRQLVSRPRYRQRVRLQRLGGVEYDMVQCRKLERPERR